MSVLKTIANIGIGHAANAEERRFIVISNYIALVFCLFVLVTNINRLILFKYPFRVSTLIVALVTIVPFILNYKGHHRASRVLLSWMPFVGNFYIYINGFSNLTLVKVSLYDSLRIYFLGFSIIPFLLLSIREKGLFLLSISVPVISIFLFNPILDLFQVGPTFKGLSGDDVYFNNIRTVFSFFIIGASALALRSVVEKSELENEKRYLQLFKSNPMPMMVINQTTYHFMDVNSSAELLLGRTLDEFKNLTLADIMPADEVKDMQVLMDIQSDQTKKSERVWRFNTQSGQLREVEITGHSIDYKNKSSIMLMVKDVTARQNANRLLTKVIDQKEALIKEIHHRIKNNLQLISSIIYIKASETRHQDAKDFLTTMRQRIRSVALVHERLLQTKAINKVDIADYLNTLTDDLISSMKQTNLKIEVRKQIESFDVNVDLAINCGLIVSELVINSMKHAFSGRSQGVIYVRLIKSTEFYQLEVGDDGVGISPELKSENSSLGTELIDLFTRQLSATMEVKKEAGTHYIFRFK